MMMTGPITEGVTPVPYVEREPDMARRLDIAQAAMAKLPQVDCPVTHRHTPGLYIREIFMPKGAVIISKIHKTEHPFVISKGKAAVWIEGQGVVELSAPHTGITKPGTRRVLVVLEDCIWTTFHPTQETDLEKIEAEVVLDRPLSCDDAGQICGEVLTLIERAKA